MAPLAEMLPPDNVIGFAKLDAPFKLVVPLNVALPVPLPVIAVVPLPTVSVPLKVLVDVPLRLSGWDPLSVPATVKEPPVPARAKGPPLIVTVPGILKAPEDVRVNTCVLSVA